MIKPELPLSLNNGKTGTSSFLKLKNQITTIYKVQVAWWLLPQKMESANWVQIPDETMFTLHYTLRKGMSIFISANYG